MAKEHGDKVWAALSVGIPELLWYIFIGPFVLLWYVITVPLTIVWYIVRFILELAMEILIGIFVALEQTMGCGCFLALIALVSIAWFVIWTLSK